MQGGSGYIAFWGMQVAGWGLYALSKRAAFPLSALDAGWILLKGLVLCTLLAFALRLLARGGAGLGMRLGFGLVFAVPLAALSLLLSRALVPLGLVLQAPGTAAWLGSTQALLLETLLFQAWALLHLGIGHALELRQQRQRVRAARDEAQQARCRMLRLQINPHLLFNALTSLRALLPRGADEARAALDALSGYLHHTLREADSASTTLAAEFEALAHYLALQKLRFAARFDYALQLDSIAAGVRIPTLLLQPLVENAVTHGLRDQDRGRVEVRARLERSRCILEVSNSGAWRESNDAMRTRPALGLANVRRRLAEELGPGHSFSIGPGAAGVRARIEFDAA